MMFSVAKKILVVVVMLCALVCCRKKTASPALNDPPPHDSTAGGSDTVPVIPAATYVQNARHVVVDGNIGGFYEALPPHYDSTDNGHGYPLIVFLHGGGELGDGNDDLPLVLKNAIPRLLDDKKFPDSFVSKGSAFSFVIISPQFREWPKPADVEAMVNYSIDHYRIDTHRLYMVGLSMGGGATWEYAAKYGKRLAAMVPISGASWADSATAKGIAATDVPTWAFHNIDDATVTYESTTRYVDFIEFFNPAFPIKMTLWPTGGHDAWTKASDPDYREDGLSIYEWMLQYVR